MSDQEIRIYPEWFTKEEEKRGLDEIRDFIRAGDYPVGALIIEKDCFFIQAPVAELTDDLREAAYQYNDGSHPLLFDFVKNDRSIKGETFHV
jgi:hypothetical protein